MKSPACRMFLVPCALFLVTGLLSFASQAYASDGAAAVQQLLAMGRYADALQEADHSLQGAGSVAGVDARRLMYLKGVALLKLQQWEEARTLFDRLAASSSDAYGQLALLRTADVSLLSGEHDRAAQEYLVFLRTFPTSVYEAQGAYGLSRAYLKQGAWGMAKKHLNIVRSKFPGSFEAVQAKELLDEGLEFTVQVGAFSRKTYADEVARSLRSDGFDAYVMTFRRMDQSLYRVRVGHFQTRSPAERLENDLQDRGFTTLLLP